MRYTLTFKFDFSEHDNVKPVDFVSDVTSRLSMLALKLRTGLTLNWRTEPPTLSTTTFSPPSFSFLSGAAETTLPNFFEKSPSDKTDGYFRYRWFSTSAVNDSL